MKYGWNIDGLKELPSFGSLTRSFFLAQLLADEVLAENLSGVRRLLEAKRADPNTVVPEHGVAALHLMAGQEDEDFGVESVLVSLSVGGDPNVRSEEGLTPVHIAAMWGRCRILEVLLSGGGDPVLIDYKMMLNAEEYALKERQWHAYGVLATFSVLAVSGVRRSWSSKKSSSEEDSEVQDDESTSSKNSFLEESENKCECNDPKSSSDVTDDDFDGRSWNREENPSSKMLVQSSPKRIFHEESEKECGSNFPKQFSDVVDVDSDWLKKTLEMIPLNENAIKIIKEQRRKTCVYEYPKSKLDSESSSLGEEEFKLPKLNNKDQESPQEFSGIYFCRLEDESFKTEMSTAKNRCPSPSEGSYSTNNDFVPNMEPRKRGVLRIMSRIFLFALRKRHVYKRLK